MIRSSALLLSIALFSSTVIAQTAQPNQAAKVGVDAVVATVNDVRITSARYESLMKFAAADPASLSSEDKARILDDIILREAITQEATKLGLLKSPSAQAQIEWARLNAITDIWWSEVIGKSPVSESDIQAEYQRLMKASKEPRNQREISLSQIVLPDEEQANSVLEELRNGVSFDEIARNKSIHKESAEKGGLLGWTLPSQLLAPLGDVSINLDKGRTNQLPVKTSFGWHIIRVNDTRPFVLPAFDQLKGQIQESLVFKQRNQALATLLAKYKVTKR